MAKSKEINIKREYKNFQEAAEHLAIKDVFIFNQHFGIDGFGIDGLHSDDYQFVVKMYDINDGTDADYKCILELTLKPW